jgi:hypothetical protein
METSHKSVKRKNRYLRSILIGFSVPIAIVAVLAIIIMMSNALCPSSWDKVKPGINISDVISSVGNPMKDCVYPDNEACFIEGYATPPKEMHGRVIIYVGCDKAMYVFLDNKDTVSKAWLGGS